jgi:ubiquinone/menaquinone biosynthesis C-methylase UbiE
MHVYSNYFFISLSPQIDVEGDELEVLFGINTKFNIIKQIIIEVHDIDNRLFNVIRILKDKGFMVTFDAQETEVIMIAYIDSYSHACIFNYIVCRIK